MASRQPNQLCFLCPRMCGVFRETRTGEGFCRMGTLPVVARAALHHWEEPCVSGSRGTGAVFFSGCTLGCSHCQNTPISQDRFGKMLSVRELADVFKHLVEEEGAQTLSLITPSHFVPAIIKALNAYRPQVPVVYNCGGYERVETIGLLEGLVDVYLPDFKHASSRLSALMAHAPDYAEAAIPAIQEMCRQTGPVIFDDLGIMVRGTLIRHLVLPGCTGDSLKVLDTIKRHFPAGTWVSLMGQYTPQAGCAIPGLDRRITPREYHRVLNHLNDLELPGYRQGLSSAEAGYTPEFDLTGLGTGAV